ncbi:MAG: hypothetical protein Q9159_004766 [Coniocarpon cinnabarinum]
MASLQTPSAGDSHETKRDLRSWWKNFRNREKQEEEKQAAVTAAAPPPNPGIFGVPLQTSIIYANVAISLTNNQGHGFIYGYVPIVVAKCGVFLKERATDVEGIFRLAGAERRIKELQATFNSPKKYGKGLDWTGYTVHDAANVLRRYINQLPEPIIPLDFYERFRDPIRGHQAQAVGNMGDQQRPSVGEFNSMAAIKTFQSLITEIPPLNRQLLLYILDLLAVFASKSETNQMNAPNLATIFQPGLLSHPSHNMAPAEYRLSQDVLIYLIDNQDNFLVGMQGTAADEKTIQEVSGSAAANRSSAAAAASPGSRQKPNVGRSTSNASAGADSLRKFGGIRRNVSTSSRRSRQSGQTPSPVTPPTESPFNKSGGVYRSNTVPSKRSSNSPSVGTARFEREKSQRRTGQPGTTGAAVAAVTQAPNSTAPVPPIRGSSAQATLSKTHESTPRQRANQARPRDPERLSPHLRPVKDKAAPNPDRQLRMDLPPSVFGPTSPNSSSPRDRPFSNYFGGRSPSADPGKDGRKPNKLQKRRPEGTQNLGAHPSNQSLSGTSHPPSPAAAPRNFTSPREMAADSRHSEPPMETIDQMRDTATANTQADKTPKPNEAPSTGAFQARTNPTQLPESGPHRSDTVRHAPTGQSQSQTMPIHLKDAQNRDSSTTIKPHKSRQGSPQSNSMSMTGDELSSRENTDDEPSEMQGSKSKKGKKHSRWRLSTSARKEAKDAKSSTSPRIGDSTDADRSTSSVGSFTKLPRKSFTDDSKESAGYQTASSEPEGGATEKKGPFGWFKNKISDRNKEREGKEREEKERAKSPPPSFSRVDPEGRSLDAAVAGGPVQNQDRGRPMEAVPENE